MAGDTLHHSVAVAEAADVDGFRREARRLLAAGVAPQRVSWHVAAAPEAGLFDTDSFDVGAAPADDLTPPVGTGLDAGPSPPAPAGQSAPALAAPPARITVPAFFVPLCERALLHADPNRFGLMYRLLWRLVHEPALRNDPLDPDRLRAESMARAVRRDMHKMTAFVRFRPITAAATGTNATATVVAPTAEPEVQHIAWFEPEHHIVRATAPFFARRFAQMRWAILTPEGSVRWDGSALAFGPGAAREDAPPADADEALWLVYYRSIFNPARLKLAMMQKEMPKRYWKNLPEAVLIAPLAAAAAQRTAAMIDVGDAAGGGTVPAHRRPAASLAMRVSQRAPEPMRVSQRQPEPAAPGSLDALRRATERCRECPIGAHATQAVNGEGAARARLMLVGEQPGDQEDLRGRPFVGPAGQLLDRALVQLGWPRDALFLTNAVRHFKFELRGQRRIHKTPAQLEQAACLHWLESEVAIVKPEAVVALGATAARALLGRAVAVTKERGQWLTRADGLPVLVTLHPSALLRLGDAARDAAYAEWLRDLDLASAWGRR